MKNTRPLFLEITEGLQFSLQRHLLGNLRADAQSAPKLQALVVYRDSLGMASGGPMFYFFSCMALSVNWGSFCQCRCTKSPTILLGVYKRTSVFLKLPIEILVTFPITQNTSIGTHARGP